MTNRNLALATLCCLAVAAASLLYAGEPVYDAWAWLVWGRELAGLALDTSSGPSFKPLPVAITTLLSVTGDSAALLWLLLVRASWLLSLVLAAALAHRLSAGLGRGSRVAAAALAALSLMLLYDEVTTWARQGAAGMSEPLLVALVLAAVTAALDERPRVTLALGALAALIRPEVWPLLAAYGLWGWRAQPALRPWVAALAVAVAALWIVPEALSGGGAASAGERARRATGPPLADLLEALGRAAVMPLLVVWPLTLFAVSRRRAAWRAAPATPGTLRARSRAPDRVLDARRGAPDRVLDARRGAPDRVLDARRGAPDRVLGVLAAGALAWIAIVALMAAAGYPGLPRFMAPALAIIGVLAGVGLARWLALARQARGAALFAVPLLVLLALGLPGRVGELPQALRTTARIERSHDDLRALAHDIGPERLLRCGRLATNEVLVRTALAWELRVPLADVVSFGALPTASGAFVVGARTPPLLEAFLRAHAQLLGSRGGWSIYAIRCAGAGAVTADGPMVPRRRHDATYGALLDASMIDCFL